MAKRKCKNCGKGRRKGRKSRGIGNIGNMNPNTEFLLGLVAGAGGSGMLEGALSKVPALKNEYMKGFAKIAIAYAGMQSGNSIAKGAALSIGVTGLNQVAKEATHKITTTGGFLSRLYNPSVTGTDYPYLNIAGVGDFDGHTFINGTNGASGAERDMRV